MLYKYAVSQSNDLIALVDIHDGFGEMADDENDNDSGEQGCHRLVPPGNYQHQQKNYQNIFFHLIFTPLVAAYWGFNEIFIALSGPSWRLSTSA